MIDIPASHLDQFLTAILALRAGNQPDEQASPRKGAGISEAPHKPTEGVKPP
jgi:hypothetical protein